MRRRSTSAATTVLLMTLAAVSSSDDEGRAPVLQVLDSGEDALETLPFAS